MFQFLRRGFAAGGRPIRHYPARRNGRRPFRAGRPGTTIIYACGLRLNEVERLPCPYFHLTATVPESLRPLFLKHQKYLYGLLTKTVSRCVNHIVREGRFIGATPAVMALLHARDGRLQPHPHVHLLAGAGGVSDDGLR